MSDTILIIDDSLTVRADLEEALSAENRPTISCATAAQARAALGSKDIGLVILDVVLPDGDGIELLQEIRATETGANTPVLMLSSEAEVKDRIRGLSTGSSEYIGKPYDRDHVVARVRQLLGTKPSNNSDEPAESKTTVLVIDDSITFRERFGEVLQAHGFNVLFAETGEEGLRSAAVNRPGAIVVDGNLPGINGQTVIHKLRLDGALRHIPCIMLTSAESDLSGLQSELQALDSGADAFVRKEENIDMILARVTAVVRNADKFKAERPANSLLSPKRILAVDDSITYLNALNDTLSREGYDVILAHSGEEALEMLGVQTVDCILLDRLMPGIDGTETCRRIKASPVTRDIPLIMLTASEDRDAMIEGLSTGADDYVLKSNEMDVLNARVRAQLRRKQFEEESRRIRAELMNKELEATEARSARMLSESRAELMAVLEQKNRDLESVVEQLRQRQQEVEERNIQLQAANRLKSEFVSNMSHEIRTPMNAIMGFAYLLGKQSLDRDSVELVNKIRNAGRTLKTIINDILDFSKIEAGWLEIENEPFRIGHILDSLSDIMFANTGQKDIELIIAPAPDIKGQLYGDELRLEQVLINLTGNAIKFSDHGAVSVGIDLVSQTDTQITLRFSVTDSGIGIPLEKQSVIFDAFSQADTSTTRRFGGTGLGLTICRNLVNKMGGEIGVISSPGSGSEFWFTIPFACNTVSEFTPSKMATIDALIVDDNVSALNNLALTARSLGWNITKAESGAEALQKIRNKQSLQSAFDIALIDWKMSDMDGMTAAEKIHEEFPGSSTAIVLMVTALSRDELLHKSNLNDIDGILNKPVTANSLFKATTEAMLNSKSEDEDDAEDEVDTDKRLAGLSALIVDDSEINREVAMRIIGAEGATVFLANDGREALEFLCRRENKIDIVLMDVQMPIMDGYEATRQIRALPHFANLPIIALTAGAFSEQQEFAFQAGMNAFSSKPFNVDELVATIQRLTNYQAQPTIGLHEVERHAGSATSDSKDFPGMAIEEGLRFWGDATRYRKFLAEFCKNYADSSDQLDTYLANGDNNALLALLHKLKGNAGYLALTDVARIAREVEAAPPTADRREGLNNLRAALTTAFYSIAKFSG